MINNKHVRQLYAGADAGHYDLPRSLVNLRAVAEALPLPVLPEPHVPSIEGLAAAAADQLIRGGELRESVAADLVDAQREHDAWTVDCRYRQTLAHAAEVAVVDTFSRSYVDLIAALQPAFTQTVEGLKRAGRILPEGIAAQTVLASDSKPMRDAWMNLHKLADRYAAIRAAATSVRRPDPEHDALGEFAEFRNLRSFFPAAGRMTRGAAPILPPWHGLDPAERLLWLVHHHAEFWLPTTAERDQLWWKAYGAGVEAQRANAWAAEGWKDLGSGESRELAARHPREVIAGRPSGSDAAA